MLNIYVYNVVVLPLRGRLASLADSSSLDSPFGHCNHRKPIFHTFQPITKVKHVK